MKNFKHILLFIGLVLLLLSCERPIYSDSETVLARVGEQYLYVSDMADNIPVKVNKSDSIQMMNSLIDNWVRQELLLQHANSNLPDSLKNFTNQLRIYENNLIIYEFKKRLVEQKLDANVDQGQIENYYNNHQKDFLLKENIVQFVYIKIPIQSEFVEEAQKLIKNIDDSTTNRAEVELFCQQHAISYFLNDEQWVPFNDLLKMVPIEAYHQEIYLKNNKMISFKDHPYWYIVNIRNFRIREDVSPLNFENRKIRNIILNQRKLQLLNNLDESIYQEATSQHQYDIY